jgi:hypothetical protein
MEGFAVVQDPQTGPNDHGHDSQDHQRRERLKPGQGLFTDAAHAPSEGPPFRSRVTG